MKLYRVILPVHDIDTAARFYGTIFEIPGERVSPGRHYFNLEGIILACYDPEADGDGIGDGWKHHFNQYCYFSVDNLESVYKRLTEAGGTPESEISEMPWGERLFYAKDPFGNPICFVDQTTVFLGSS